MSNLRTWQVQENYHYAAYSGCIFCWEVEVEVFMVPVRRAICWFYHAFLLFYFSLFYFQSIVCHMILFVISFSFSTGCMCTWCALLGKYFEMHTWGWCSVLRVQHLGPVMRRERHSELLLTGRGRVWQVNSLHTQDFKHCGFWLREKLRWVAQTWSQVTPLCVREMCED